MSDIPYVTYVSVDPGTWHGPEWQRLAHEDGQRMTGTGTVNDYRRWIRDVRFGDYKAEVFDSNAELASITFEISNHPASLHPESRYEPGTPISIRTQYDIPLGLGYLAFIDMMYHCALLRGEHDGRELLRARLAVSRPTRPALRAAHPTGRAAGCLTSKQETT